MRVPDFNGGYVDVEPTITTKCGNVAKFDHDSGHAYRCTRCGAVVGSMGMPRECFDLYEQERMWIKLGGKVEPQ